MTFLKFDKTASEFFCGLLLFCILAISCTRENDPKREWQSGETIYMSFDAVVHRSMREQGDQPGEPSLNQDAKDREDYVTRLGVWVFDSATGRLVTHHISSETAFTLVFKPGTLDFYFIANYPQEIEGDLTGVANRNRLDELMKRLFAYTAHHTSADFAMPMARIYKNQHITSGGTPEAPVAFVPQLSGSNTLAPVSLHDSDPNPQSINLLHACAKISLALTGTGAHEVKKVVFAGAASHFSLQQIEPAATVATQTVDFALQGGKNIIYIPERLFARGQKPIWLRDKALGKDEPNGAPHLLIIMNSGREYRVPVIGNGEGQDNYMAFARSDEADYNIIRNHHYNYELNIPQDNKEIQVTAKVLPWTLNTSEMDYTESEVRELEFDFEPKTGGEISSDKRIITLHGNTKLIIRGGFTKPVGAIWMVSITNGFEFKLESQTARGLVGPNATTFETHVQPLKMAVGKVHITQLYITLNSKEVQVSPGHQGLEPGPKNRILIKQVS